MSYPFFLQSLYSIALVSSLKFHVANRTVNFASISSNDIVFPSNVIGTEANGAFVLAEH